MKVWDLCFTNKNGKIQISEIIQSNTQDSNRLIVLMLNDLKNAVVINDTKRIDDILDIILIACKDKDKDKIDLISKQIDEIFETDVLRSGFVDAYKRIIKLNQDEEEFFEEEEIINRYANKIRYMSEYEIGTANISRNLVDALNNQDLNNGIVLQLSLGYFKSIYMNSVISKQFREKLIDEYFRSICNFYFIKAQEVSQKSIFYIFRTYVLQNEKTSEAEYVFSCMVKYLFAYNNITISNTYIMTVAIIYESLFFYSYYEIETLGEAHRNWLISLFDKTVPTIDKEPMGLKELISKRADNIVEMIITDSVEKPNHNMIFDYYPLGGNGKNAVWCFSNQIQFSYYLYTAVGYKYTNKTFFDLLKDCILDQGELLDACHNVMETHDPVSDAPNDYALEIIAKIQKSLQESEGLNSGIYIQNIEEINAFIKAKNGEKANGEGLKTTEESVLFESVLKHIRQDDMLKYSKDTNVENGKTYFLRPMILKKDISEEVLGYYLGQAAENIANIIFESALTKYKLYYDENAAKELVKYLQSHNIKTTNYNCVADYAFSKKIRETPEFKKLSNYYKKLNTLRAPLIYHKIFLTSSPVNFNFTVGKHDGEDISHEMASMHIDKYKVSDSKYRIDNCLYERKEAMEYYIKSYLLYKLSLKFVCQLDQNSGFILDLHNRDELE